MSSQPMLWVDGLKVGIVTAAILLGSLTGCEGHGRHGGPGAGPGDQVAGDIVSTVNGRGISLVEVTDIAKATELEPKETLARLQARLLLLERAKQRTDSLSTKARREVRQATVQAFLVDTVERHQAGDDDVREARKEQAKRFSRAEHRASRHVLAVVKQDGPAAEKERAFSFARKAVKLLRDEPDFAELKRKATELGAGEPFEVKVEQVPPAAVDSPFAPEYLDGLFSLDAKGVVPEPVATSFGVHAIEVTHVLPAKTATFEEARAILEPELTLEMRQREMKQLDRSLRQQIPIEINDDAVSILVEIEP